MRARVTLEPAYLLNRRPYSDSSLLLEAITRGHGRIGLVARGARGAKSKLRGLLQPFAPLLLSWNASGELATLSAAEAAGPPLLLAGERVFFGWYLNELLLRLLQRQDAHAALFDAYALAVQQLPGAATQAEDALRMFEKTLLAEIGYGLLLPDDLDAAQRYHYDADAGPQPAASDAPQAYAGASLIALRDERLATAEARRDARRLLRAALAAQLGSKPLQTPLLMREMREAQDAG
ncbi:DNA repair protein RecO [Solimonas soli]|uniref:DNA repair protein RecO n=1 Tax=Solimonas soli TaxID=413479 RepID=UPI00047FB422|nr:DNA repair protein RecO [Solimonas soli]